LDFDKNGTIGYTEFLSATLDCNFYIQKEKLWESFNVFDVNRNGTISSAELRELLSQAEGHSLQPDQCDLMIQSFDKNRDGVVDFEEFCDMMKQSRRQIN
jgi:calcium-dependent protein kinase